MSRISTGCNRKLRHTILLGITFFLSAGAWAYPLPGTTPTPPATTEAPGLVVSTAGEVLLADMKVPYSFTTTAGTTSGTIESAVYREGVGTLDFDYQIANSATSATALTLAKITSFMGVHTSTGYLADGSTPPAVADLDATGKVIGFHFATGLGMSLLRPGDTSDFLIVSTTASTYGPGNVAVIDGGAAMVKAFGPAAVPEPASAVLFVLGVLVVAWIPRFRSDRIG